MEWRIPVKATIVVTVCFLLCATAWPQAVTVAQINGSVKDQSEALLPGVEIKVTQTETGYTRSVVTDETGRYTIPNLPVGPYRFEASLPGFRSCVQPDITQPENNNQTIRLIHEVAH